MKVSGLFEAGSVLGAYRIVRLLGRGGMGCVYEAEHIELRIRRALKVFAAESEHTEFLRRRFLAEGRILADLDHPRIVRVYDFAIDPVSGVPYFAMDLILSPSGESQTLEAACREGVDEDRIASWFRDISDGLAYIHSKDVVHRDISLDNILIDAEGRAVLSDFGIAKIIGEDYRRRIDVTRTMVAKDGSGFSMGKGLYMAPELATGGEASPASDAYAFGVLLFRILSGSWYTPDAHLEDALAGLDYNWSEVIGGLCAIRPEERTVDFVSLLRKPPAVRRTPSRRSSIALAVAALSVAVGFAAYALVGAVSRLVMRGQTPKSAAPPPSLGTPIYHIVDVTNYVPQTVYQIIPVTNRVEAK